MLCHIGWKSNCKSFLLCIFNNSVLNFCLNRKLILPIRSFMSQKSSHSLAEKEFWPWNGLVVKTLGVWLAYPQEILLFVTLTVSRGNKLMLKDAFLIWYDLVLPFLLVVWHPALDNIQNFLWSQFDMRELSMKPIGLYWRCLNSSFIVLNSWSFGFV